MQTNKTVTDIEKLIGQKLFKIRKDQKINRGHLAKSVNISKQQLFKYEKGINRITVGRLILMCKYLRISISDFLHLVEDISSHSNDKK